MASTPFDSPSHAPPQMPIHRLTEGELREFLV